MFKVDGHSDLLRNGDNSAVVSVNFSEYEKFREQFAIRKNAAERINNLEEKINQQNVIIEQQTKMLESILELLKER